MKKILSVILSIVMIFTMLTTFFVITPEAKVVEQYTVSAALNNPEIL